MRSCNIIFCVCPSPVSYGSIHVFTDGGIFFSLWVSNIALGVCACAYTQHSLLSIRLSTNTGCFYILSIRSNCTDWACRNPFKGLVSFPLGIYPEMGMLDQIVALFLIFLEPLYWFSWYLYQFTINFVLQEDMNKYKSRKNSIMSPEHPSPLTLLS